MAKQTYDVAVQHVYTDIHENEVPSEEYKSSRFEVCKRQIALAGYRLADWLKKALAP